MDIYELVGEFIDGRLKVLRLAYISAYKWIYEVEPPSVGKTRRGLKVLASPEARQKGSYDRLHQLATQLKQIQSPYLERVYESGQLYDQTPYLLTDWEPHTSLHEFLRLKRKSLGWGEVKSILHEVALGLIHLHERGLVHGDLRAQHVLLRNTDHNAVLTDIGVDNALRSPPSPGLDKSLAYWSPERHTFLQATPAADMYSYGVLIFFCLEGVLPFQPDLEWCMNQNPPVDPSVAIVELHQRASPPPFKTNVPKEVKDMVLRLLAKNPLERPARMSEVIQELFNDVSHQPSSMNEISDIDVKLSPESSTIAAASETTPIDVTPPIQTWNQVDTPPSISQSRLFVASTVALILGHLLSLLIK